MKTTPASFGLLLIALALPGMAATNEIALLDGKSLNGWQVVAFDGAGPVAVKEEGVLEIGVGDSLSGIVFTNTPPRLPYEIALEGRRTDGSDFFCGLTFPVGSNSCTLILGGWGGSLTGVSSIDGADASENQTSGTFDFEQNRWYPIRLRVTTQSIEAWLGDRQIVNLDTAEKRLGMRWGDIERCMPLGLATWQTKGELRHIRLRQWDG